MKGLKLFPVYVATLLQLYYGTSGTPTKEYCSISKTAVQILNTFTFKPARVLKTVRKLVLITLKSNIIIKAKHLTKAYFCCWQNFLFAMEKILISAARCRLFANSSSQPGWEDQIKESKKLILNSVALSTCKTYQTTHTANSKILSEVITTSQ